MDAKIRDAVRRIIDPQENLHCADEIEFAGMVPDMVLVGGGRTIMVEVKNRADMQSLARLALYSRLMGNDKGEPSLVLAAKSFSGHVLKVAEEAGISTLTLPKDLDLKDRTGEERSGRIRLATEKSWKVITRLYKDQPLSIRAISLSEGVSYGWAHTVCRFLLDEGMASRRNNYVMISDMDKIINGVAWERPLSSLRTMDIRTNIKDVFSAAEEVGRFLGPHSAEHAFAGYLAGSLYTGQAVRFDMMHLYLSQSDAMDIKETFSVDGGGGVIIQALRPDRDLFADSRVVDGLRVTSPSQTLLDLAGLGYGAMDLTKALMRDYASL